VHLVGFVVGIYYDARTNERQIDDKFCADKYQMWNRQETKVITVSLGKYLAQTH
jgi:hypothetical protein